MHHPHDQRFKAGFAVLMELIAEVELERAVHIAPPRIDATFEPRPGVRVPELGLLDRMGALGPGMIEYYSSTVRSGSFETCLRKRLDYAHERQVTAARQALAEPASPRLWIVSTGHPRKALADYEARPMDGWPAGCFHTRAVDRAHLVVLRDLPETPDTLALRLFGRGRTLQRALEELAALPAEHLLRRRLQPVMLAFQNQIVQDIGRFQAMNVLDRVHSVYDEWHREAVESGRRAGHKEGRKEGRKAGHKEGRREGQEQVLCKLLTQRFGPLPEDIRTRLRRADAESLERWLERLLSAPSLEALFD